MQRFHVVISASSIVFIDTIDSRASKFLHTITTRVTLLIFAHLPYIQFPQDAILCKSCGIWIHGRCANIKRVTNRLAIKCRKCKRHHENVEDQKEILNDDVETLTEFLYLGERMNSGHRCEAVVISRTRTEWAKFMQCQQ